MHLSVRPLKKEDIPIIIDYFLEASPEFMHGMGVDISRLPAREEWLNMLYKEFNIEDRRKSFYYIIWMLDGKAIGHSNINWIKYGEEAYMHLHVWKPLQRQKGLGEQFLRKTIPYYFETFTLKRIYCQPYIHNPAPNKILPKLGFTFMKKYECTPGWINFPQEVNLYELTKENFEIQINDQKI